MRCVAVMLVLAGCGEPRYVAKPLPPLAPPEERPQAQEIVIHDIGLAVGDHWIWDVQARGFSIGRVELEVGEQEIVSHFRTNELASAIAHVQHDLVTIVDRTLGRAETSTERLDYRGKLRQFSTLHAGATHSFHSALGALRAWATPGARPGVLHVVHAEKVYRFELEQPVAQLGPSGKMLRIDGKVIGPDIDPIMLSVWLDDSRVPRRIEVRDGEDRVTAQLIE